MGSAMMLLLLIASLSFASASVEILPKVVEKHRVKAVATVQKNGLMPLLWTWDASTSTVLWP